MITRLDAKKYEIDTEVRIDTSKGYKKRRYADIAATKKRFYRSINSIGVEH